MTLKERIDWTQDGTFPDANGVPVRAYDDVRLKRNAQTRAAGNVSLPEVPAGSQATVLFFTTGRPQLLDLECDVGENGFVFAQEYAEFVEFAIRCEDKYRGR